MKGRGNRDSKNHMRIILNKRESARARESIKTFSGTGKIGHAVVKLHTKRPKKRKIKVGNFFLESFVKGG